LCARHAHQPDFQLSANGPTDEECEGNMLDLRTEQPTAHIGRRGGEARFARWVLRGELMKQLDRELRFARAQFDALSRTGQAHKTTQLANRLWQLQHRIDALEVRIAGLQEKERDKGRE
jgi:hypothetical protein